MVWQIKLKKKKNCVCNSVGAGFDPLAKLACLCSPFLWQTVVVDETVVWRALDSPLGAQPFA